MVIKPLKEFSKSSVRLVKRCTKPDSKGARLRSESAVASSSTGALASSWFLVGLNVPF